jgi:predicted phage terminase large subunit-like protein
MEIVQHERFNEVFPESPLVMQNAKREEIWLKRYKRYPSITFVPINGSMTGRAEASRYLYCDDLVSGIEEALSPDRLNKLWEKYSTDAKQRKLDGCKEIHIATPWSVHDVISKLKESNSENSRVKVVEIPCYNDEGESNFDFFGGFSTKYYKDIEKDMDPASFSALYKQEPIEREGILYNKDELTYYFELPRERPDAIVAVVDSKNLGKDYVSCPILYIYGEFAYLDDVVYNNGLPEVTKELVANKLVEHGVARADVEMNNGGNYYAEGVNDLVKKKGGNTTFRLFFTSNNKTVKIISYSDFVKKRILFRDPSTYSENSDYGKFMKGVHSWTQTGKNKHDDGVDTLAMAAQLMQDLSCSSIKIMKRSELGL